MSTLSSKLILSLINRVTGPARAVGKSLAYLRQAAARNERQMNAMRGRMVAAAGAGYALYRGLLAPTKAAINFESAMSDVRKVVDFPTPAAFRKMGKDIIAMSKRLPMAADGLAAIAAAAGQADMKGAEIFAFTEMAAKVGVAFDMSAAEVGGALAKIKSALGLTVGQTGELADAINHLSNTTASSAPDLVRFMRQAGPAGKAYGFTAIQTAAYGAAMISAGFQADVAKTSFMNMGRALAAGGNATKRQRKAFSKLGLDAKKVAKSLQKNAVGTLDDVLERVRKLPKHIQASTMSQLFGNEARALMPLLQNADLLKEALKSVEQRVNYLGSSQKEYEVRARTTANKMQLFKNQVSALGIAIGSALLPTITDLMKQISPVIARVAAWAEKNPQLTRTIVAVTASVIALTAASAAAKFALLFVKGGLIDVGIVALSSASRVKAAAVAIGAGFKRIRLAMIGATMLSAVGSGGLMAGLVSSVASIGPAILATGSGILAAMAAITAPVWAVVAAITLAVASVALAFYKYWEPISNFVSGFVSGIKSAAQPLVDYLKAMGPKILAAVGSWSKQKIVDFGAMLGFDPKTVGTYVDTGVAAVKSSFGKMIAYIKSLPSLVGGWASDLFSMKDYSAKAEAGFRDAGKNAAKALIDAIKSGVSSGAIFGPVGVAIKAMAPKLKSVWVNALSFFDSLSDGGFSSMIKSAKKAIADVVKFFATLPIKIIKAIGEIDLTKIIKWPSWENRPAWMGGSGAKAGKSASGGLWSGIKSKFGFKPKVDPAEINAATVAGKKLKSTLAITAAPKVDTTAIDVATAKARRLRKVLEAAGSNITVKSIPPIAGAKALGGNVAGGKTYLVGEQGPELFTAPSNGYVTPNHQLNQGGANVPTTQPQAAQAGQTKATSQTIHVNIGDITVTEAQNAQQIAQEIGQQLREELSGVQVDSEFSVS